ncbi:hypothetical protein KQX54_018587 [Cotesia glomerata]|uniref:Uncharacterized protein n=1 Tax=Cotesia glomerata TaxID=32391 RepID=A0AAV7HVJ7_COTGL|nr:hypothetical protein KQX54_018587 [Cotesia glomerata]
MPAWNRRGQEQGQKKPELQLNSRIGCFFAVARYDDADADGLREEVNCSGTTVPMAARANIRDEGPRLMWLSAGPLRRNWKCTRGISKLQLLFANLEYGEWELELQRKRVTLLEDKSCERKSKSFSF